MPPVADVTLEFAAAKVNLFLHVGVRQEDGFHPICSLMSFAEIGDEIRLQLSETMEFAVEGPFADDLALETNNLVELARDKLLPAFETAAPPFRLVLDKRVPIAAGLGGGSSDAAATLRAVRRAFDLKVSDSTLAKLAGEIGADAPACLRAEPVIATGRGDLLSSAPIFPDLHIVLANPLAPSSTAAVYRAYDAAPYSSKAPNLPKSVSSVREAAEFLRGCRNDLEDAAMRVQPAIGEVLAILRAQPETLLSRMSGSGATCFAVCAGERESAKLQARLAYYKPHWWSKSTIIAGGRAH